MKIVFIFIKATAMFIKRSRIMPSRERVSHLRKAIDWIVSSNKQRRGSVLLTLCERKAWKKIWIAGTDLGNYHLWASTM
jgi:hypothetical protein